MCLNKTILFTLLLVFAATPSNAIFGLGKESRAQKTALEYARAVYESGDYGLTIDLMEEFLLKTSSKKNQRGAYVLLGEAYKKQNAYDKALLKYSEAAEFFPKDIELNLALADVYYVGGLADNAVKTYNKVLRLAPGNLPALLALARAYLAGGSFTRSARYFKEYLDTGGRPDAAFYYDYAQSNYQARNYDTALELVAESTALEQTANAAFLTAKIYKAKGDDKQAFGNIAIACALPEAGDEIWLTRALWMAYDEGYNKEALAIADNYLKKDESDRLALFVKYFTYYRMGRRAEGIKYLQKIAAQDGNGFIENIARRILRTETVEKTSNLKI